MINEIERWKQAEKWLDECDARIHTILDTEDDDDLRWLAEKVLERTAQLGFSYSAKIKSRETLKAQLQDSLSQATDGGKE